MPNTPKLLVCPPKNASQLDNVLESTNTRKNDLLSYFEECVEDNEDEDDENDELDEANVNFTSEKDSALAQKCLKLGLKGEIPLPDREGTSLD